MCVYIYIKICKHNAPEAHGPMGAHGGPWGPMGPGPWGPPWGPQSMRKHANTCENMRKHAKTCNNVKHIKKRHTGNSNTWQASASRVSDRRGQSCGLCMLLDCPSYKYATE